MYVSKPNKTFCGSDMGIFLEQNIPHIKAVMSNLC